MYGMTMLKNMTNYQTKQKIKLTLIDEDMADFLAKDKPRRVNVTLYGASNKTYERLCK